MLTLRIVDVLLLPLYIALLYLFIKFYNKRYNENALKGLFVKGFFIKIFFGIAFALFSIFLIPGDTEMYFTGGLDFKKIIFADIANLNFFFSSGKDFGDYYEINNYRTENFGYVSSIGNLMPMKFVAIISVFTFDSYILTSLFFTLFSFLGLWYMFKTFYRIYPTYKKAIYLPFFLIPSVLFWGGGLGKDTLCTGFLGIALYNSYLFFFEKKYKIRYLLAFIISYYLLYATKSYIAAAIIPSFIYWYVIHRIIEIKNQLLKVTLIVTPIFLLLISLLFLDVNEIIAENSAEVISENIISTKKNYERATPDDGALLDYGEIVPTPAGLAKLLPKALVAALFRPFIWEAKKITSVAAAIEGTLLFCFTLYVFLRRGIFFSIKAIASDTTIFFCFIFSIVFATAVGLNCFNLGTLVRYKIPCLPFYILSLILILKKQQQPKPGLGIFH